MVPIPGDWIPTNEGESAVPDLRVEEAEVRLARAHPQEAGRYGRGAVASGARTDVHAALFHIVPDGPAARIAQRVELSLHRKVAAPGHDERIVGIQRALLDVCREDKADLTACSREDGCMVVRRTA